MERQNLAILRQFLMEYGSIMGISWATVFGLYVGGLRSQNGGLLLAALLGLFIILGINFFFGIRAKIRTVQLELHLSPLFAFVNILSMFMYACLLCGAIEFAYFQFFDKGTLQVAMQAMFTDNEVRLMYMQMGMQDAYKQLTEMLTEVGTLSALDKTLLLFNQSFIVGLILSVPVTVTYILYKPRNIAH